MQGEEKRGYKGGREGEREVRTISMKYGVCSLYMNKNKNLPRKNV